MWSALLRREGDVLPYPVHLLHVYLRRLLVGCMKELFELAKSVA